MGKSNVKVKIAQKVCPSHKTSAKKIHFLKGSVKGFAQLPDHPLFEVKIPAQNVLAISAPQLPATGITAEK